MSELLKNIFRFILFIFVQVFILFKMPPLHRFITPYLFGLSLDYFMHTPGLHAAACVLIAYLRPFVVNMLISQEGADKNYLSPSVTSMGWAPYFTYVFVLTLFHHGYLVFLEWMSFGSFLYFIGKVVATTGISMLLILLTELLFFRKEKFRTNTV